jgi:hypothetical protein
MSVGFVVFGPAARQDIVVESMWWSKAAHSVAARKQRDRRRDLGVPGPL